MNDPNEDYRRTLLYRNATAVMDAIDAQNSRIDKLNELRLHDGETIAMLQAEVRVLTQRFNELFIRSVGTGATSGDLD